MDRLPFQQTVCGIIKQTSRSTFNQFVTVMFCSFAERWGPFSKLMLFVREKKKSNSQLDVKRLSASPISSPHPRSGETHRNMFVVFSGERGRSEFRSCVKVEVAVLGSPS